MKGFKAESVRWGRRFQNNLTPVALFKEAVNVENTLKCFRAYVPLISSITSCNPRGANLAKHTRLQLVIDRWSLSSHLKF